MNAIAKGVAVAVLHLLIVVSVSGKFLYDRAHRPRVWAKTSPVDPSLPIRGRYMALQLEVQAPWFRLGPKGSYWSSAVTLTAENDALTAHKSDAQTGLTITTWSQPSGTGTATLDQSVLFFLPEHADFPRIKPGEELWAEVTIPKTGPPRPIQLALKRGTEWKPLTYR